MNSFRMPKKWWLLLLIPVFSKSVCSKSHDDVLEPTGDQYITWSIGSSSGFLSSPPDTVGMVRQSNVTVFYGYTGFANSSVSNFYGSFAGAQSVGSYSSSGVVLLTGGKYYVQTATPLQINVASYGAAGQYITGTYSGTLKDSTGSATLSVNGQFKIKNR